MNETSRSYLKITLDDLRRLASIARDDREDLFTRKPKLASLYADRILIVALCQGAAIYYVDGKNGIKDFDVWTFFRAHPLCPFPYRRNVHRDFGDSKFGRTPGRIKFIGRSVDCAFRGNRPVNPVQNGHLSERSDAGFSL